MTTTCAGSPADVIAVYRYVTTVQGNGFRFRGGDPVMLRESARVACPRLCVGMGC